MKRHPECRYRAELDMETLVWTRGRAFPLSRLESRLRCPLAPATWHLSDPVVLSTEATTTTGLQTDF